MSDLMIDIETLAVSPNSTILTIGAQGFDPFSDTYTDVTFYERITLESQDGRDVDDNTVAWWAKQSEEAQEEAFGEDGRIAIKEALEKLAKIAWKHSNLWANGITFDFVILENAMQAYGVSVPWKYWQLHDARTVYKICPDLPKLGNNHNALMDCCNQIDLLQQALEQLGITTFKARKRA